MKICSCVFFPLLEGALLGLIPLLIGLIGWILHFIGLLAGFCASLTGFSSLHRAVVRIPSLICWTVALLTGFSSRHRIVIRILSLICWIVALLTGFFTSLVYWLESMSCLLGFCLVDWILLFFALLAGFYVSFADFCLVDSVIHFIGLLAGFCVLLSTSLLCWLDSLPCWLIFSAHLQSSSPYSLDSLPHLFGCWLDSVPC